MKKVCEVLKSAPESIIIKEVEKKVEVYLPAGAQVIKLIDACVWFFVFFFSFDEKHKGAQRAKLRRSNDERERERERSLITQLG